MPQPSLNQYNPVPRTPSGQAGTARSRRTGDAFQVFGGEGQDVDRFLVDPTNPSKTFTIRPPTTNISLTTGASTWTLTLPHSDTVYYQENILSIKKFDVGSGYISLELVPGDTYNNGASSIYIRQTGEIRSFISTGSTWIDWGHEDLQDVQTVTGNATISAPQNYLIVTATDATITLPDALEYENLPVTIKRNTFVAGNTTIVPMGADTIDIGSPVLLGGTTRPAITLLSNGSEWKAISEYHQSNNPTFDFGAGNTTLTTPTKWFKSTSADATIILPLASLYPAKELTVKRGTAAAGNTTVNTQGSDKIDVAGTTSIVLNTAWQSITFASAGGTTWTRVGEYN